MPKNSAPTNNKAPVKILRSRTATAQMGNQLFSPELRLPQRDNSSEERLIRHPPVDADEDEQVWLVEDPSPVRQLQKPILYSQHRNKERSDNNWTQKSWFLLTTEELLFSQRSQWLRQSVPDWRPTFKTTGCYLQTHWIWIYPRRKSPVPWSIRESLPEAPNCNLNLSVIYVNLAVLIIIWESIIEFYCKFRISCWHSHTSKSWID